MHNSTPQDLKRMLYGISMMLLQALAMAIIYTFTKQLSQSLHTHQVAFLYKFAILIVMLPWCAIGGLQKNLKTKKIGLHVARGTFSIMGSLCFFYSLAKIDLLDAAAITYLEQILVILIGVIYLKEQLSVAKVMFIIFGCCGAFLIIKPGFVEFNRYYIFIFLALIFWAMNNFSIKVLGRTERTKAQLFYVVLVSSILSFPLALHEWRPVNFEHLKLILIIAVCYLIHVVAFFKAFKNSDISTVMPFDYMRLVFVGISGYLYLKEVPDKFSIIGYALITLGGLYMIHEEARKIRGLSKKLTQKRIMELESQYEQV